MNPFFLRWRRQLGILLIVTIFMVAWLLPWIYMLSRTFYSKDISAFPVVFSKQAGWTPTRLPFFFNDKDDAKRLFFIRPKAILSTGNEYAFVECGTALSATTRENPIVVEHLLVGDLGFLLLRPTPNSSNFFIVPEYGCVVAPPSRFALQDVVRNTPSKK